MSAFWKVYRGLLGPFPLSFATGFELPPPSSHPSYFFEFGCCNPPRQFCLFALSLPIFFGWASCNFSIITNYFLLTNPFYAKVKHFLISEMKFIPPNPQFCYSIYWWGLNHLATNDFFQLALNFKFCIAIIILTASLSQFPPCFWF